MSDVRPLSYNNARGPCAVCGESGLPCARCRVHYYCGKAHQKQHWPQHRGGCGSIALQDGVVVATRHIPAGTVLMREVPLLTFPPTPLKYNLLHIKWACAACWANLSAMRPVYQCSRCGLPVCDDRCSQAANHRVECEAMQRSQYKVSKAELGTPLDPFWGAFVATLRIAAAFRDNRHPLLHHLDRKFNFDKEGWKKMPGAAREVDDTLMACSVLVGMMCNTVKEFSRDELERAARVAYMYGEDVEGRCPARFGDNRQRSGRHLYLGMQLRMNSCCPNTGDWCTAKDTAEFVVVTTRDISAGECITKNHQGCHWGQPTPMRRYHIFVRWGFICQCERCNDPTEMGTYVGSPCCPARACAGKGRQNYLVPVDKDHRQWRCGGCKKKMTAAQVQSLTRRAEEQLDGLQGSPPARLLKFIADHLHPRGPLHPTHTLVLRAKDYLRLFIYGHRAEDNAGEAEIDSWEAVVRDLLLVLDRLLPGTSETRVMLLFELRRLLLWRARQVDPSALADCLKTLKQPGPVDVAMDPGVLKVTKAVLEVNQELCRYHFNRDEDEPKRTLINDPFSRR